MTKTAKQKAQSGLESLKTAALEVIEQHPDDGVTNAEIADILGIVSCDKQGDHKNWLTRSILYILESEKKIHQRNSGKSFFPGKGQ